MLYKTNQFYLQLLFPLAVDVDPLACTWPESPSGPASLILEVTVSAKIFCLSSNSNISLAILLSTLYIPHLFPHSSPACAKSLHGSRSSPSAPCSLSQQRNRTVGARHISLSYQSEKNGIKKSSTAALNPLCQL